MAEPNFTHAEFAAKLVLEGCLPIVAGKPLSKMPIEALPLQREEQLRLGLDPAGLSVFYPLGETGVFLHMKGSRARVWFGEADCDTAVKIFERELKRDHPKAKLTKQVKHPEERDMSVRIYRVEFDKNHLADIELTYPTGKAAKQQFWARVHAWERR